MKGDILIIDDKHRKAARQIFGLIGTRMERKGKFFITVAGESGAGKSETAAALAEVLESAGHPTLVIQQDDFFIYPPRTNAAIRVETDGRVGPHEVDLAGMDRIIQDIRSGRERFEKPLVIFAEDRITSEELDSAPYHAIIMEGTYTMLLGRVDCKVFIDRDLDDTRQDRLKRNREKQDAFLEKILQTEHEIISGHKPMADVWITKEFDATPNPART